MDPFDRLLLGKAEENLAVAESEFANRRYKGTAYRCYFACSQAAVYALLKEGIRPTNRPDVWGHDFVQAQFNGLLINRRKLYPAILRNVLAQNYALREIADYKRDHVTEIKAARALARTTQFVSAIQEHEGARR